MPEQYNKNDAFWKYKRTDYPYLINHTNDTSPKNYSHLENEPENFNLKQIDFEDIDKAVYDEFNQRFIIRNEPLLLIKLDSEYIAMVNENIKNFDSEKKFLGFPYFTYIRTQTVKVGRTSPSTKPVVYVVPKKKAQGIVFEEWITECPILYEMTYELKFATNIRQTANEMQQQFFEYFKTKANMILCNSERFAVRPLDTNNFGQIQIENRESVSQRAFYNIDFSVKVWAFTRNLENMQKRERPNNLSITFLENDGKPTYLQSRKKIIDKMEMNLKFPQNKLNKK